MVRQGARALTERGVRFDCAWSSPLPRAVQTAELLLAGIGDEVVLEVYEDLTPEGSAGEVLARLAELPEESHLLIVSHEPLAGRLASVLKGEPGMGLHTAEIRHFHLASAEPSGGKLVWRWLTSGLGQESQGGR